MESTPTNKNDRRWNFSTFAKMRVFFCWHLVDAQKKVKIGRKHQIIISIESNKPKIYTPKLRNGQNTLLIFHRCEVSVTFVEEKRVHVRVLRHFHRYSLPTKWCFVCSFSNFLVHLVSYYLRQEECSIFAVAYRRRVQFLHVICFFSSALLCVHNNFSFVCAFYLTW